jgi:hypothetical protein
MPEARIAALTAGERRALQSDRLWAPAGALMGYGRRVMPTTRLDPGSLVSERSLAGRHAFG